MSLLYSDWARIRYLHNPATCGDSASCTNRKNGIAYLELCASRTVQLKTLTFASTCRPSKYGLRVVESDAIVQVKTKLINFAIEVDKSYY